MPHFFGPNLFGPDADEYASTKGNVEKRLNVLKSAILSFIRIFGYKQHINDIGYLARGSKKSIYPANQREYSEVSIIICTSGNFHLLNRLKDEEIKFNNISTDIDPKYLGLVCHSVMKDFRGQFDYFCYIEDDIIIQDPFFFNKLKWFNQKMGDDYVLQPNRYEISDKGIIEKLYIDGFLPDFCTNPYKDLSLLQDIYLEYLDTKIKFYASSNPHSGCFFLNTKQFETWSTKPYFLDGDINFFGPLESFATLGILKCFKPYKASPEYANFFEVLHGDNRFI